MPLDVYVRIMVLALGLAAVREARPSFSAALVSGLREASSDVVASAEDTRATRRRVDAGRSLFFSAALSIDSSVSCASCHRPDHAFADPRSISLGVGIRARRRNAPTLHDVELYRSTFDWDGKARTLRAQLSHVFSRDGDMGWGLREAVARVRSDAPLREASVSAYDGHPTVENVVDALILFQRSLDGGLSRFDRYYLLSDSVALSARERRGWELFRGSTAGCAGCHVPLPEPRGRQVLVLRDNRFHNLGVGYSAGVFHDLGHEEVSLKSADRGAFATPSLRHVAATAPYMHDGSLASLDEVVRFYERGGIANPQKDVTLRPFVLSDVERRDLVAFLCTLTGENVAGTLNDPSCRE